MPTAAYDEIADWYEQEFLANQQANDGMADPDRLGINHALRELLGNGSGTCLEIGCGTGVHAATVRKLGWTPVGVDLSAGCCATREAALLPRKPMPNSYRSAAAGCAPPSR